MHFTKTVDKLSKWIKSYGLTSVVFGQNGHFGAFLALKFPGGGEVDFSQGKCYLFYNKNMCLHILTKFQKNWMNGSKVIVQKVSFLAIFAHFGGFLTPFEPLGP